jgi:hypothetical protein
MRRRRHNGSVYGPPRIVRINWHRVHSARRPCTAQRACVHDRHLNCRNAKASRLLTSPRPHQCERKLTDSFSHGHCAHSALINHIQFLSALPTVTIALVPQPTRSHSHPAVSAPSLFGLGLIHPSLSVSSNTGSVVSSPTSPNVTTCATTRCRTRSFDSASIRSAPPPSSPHRRPHRERLRVRRIRSSGCGEKWILLRREESL